MTTAHVRDEAADAWRGLALATACSIALWFVLWIALAVVFV